MSFTVRISSHKHTCFNSTVLNMWIYVGMVAKKFWVDVLKQSKPSPYHVSQFRRVRLCGGTRFFCGIFVHHVHPS